MAEPNIIHQAERDETTGRVIFLFVHGEARLVGQVPTEDEYRALLIFFEGWRGVKLPAASAPDEWIADMWKGADRD